tara:strand:- start:947 stop:1594 length:648 start_codon:yes stop_codon:yes gene_type:complete
MGFLMWEKQEDIYENVWQFLSHAGMWASQIPILYVWRKPIVSLALTFLTACSMQYHKHMFLKSKLSVVNRWLILDYVGILVSIPVAFIPYSTLPKSSRWTETAEGIALIILVIIMALIGASVLFPVIKQPRWFHSFWHVYICAPLLLYAYMKGDIREVYDSGTFWLLETTAIAAFFTLVVSRAENILLCAEDHKEDGEKGQGVLAQIKAKTSLLF